MQGYAWFTRALRAPLVVVVFGTMVFGANGARSQQQQPTPGAPAPAAAPAPAPAPVPQMFEYAVKFVCGRSIANPKVSPPVAPGFYSTAVNVHNPQPGTVEFRKKFAQALPNQKAGKVSDFFGAVLKTNEAFEIDCPEISKAVGVPPGRFAKGFVVIQTGRELDVVAVYTAAAQPNGPVVTMDVERVPKRP